MRSLAVQRKVVEELGHQHLGQQAGRGDALVDDLRWNRRLYELLAVRTGPLAAHMALYGEHTGLIVQPLGDILANALHLATAGAGGVLELMVHVAARQVRR